MIMFYKLTYWIGSTPWEEMAALPIAKQISFPFDREERERQPPCGSAFDLGGSRGVWTVKLAGRGRQVTGIEIIPKALRAARLRTRPACQGRLDLSRMPNHASIAFDASNLYTVHLFAMRFQYVGDSAQQQMI
jgi:hypothetical protein